MRPDVLGAMINSSDQHVNSFFGVKRAPVLPPIGLCVESSRGGRKFARVLRCKLRLGTRRNSQPKNHKCRGVATGRVPRRGIQPFVRAATRLRAAAKMSVMLSLVGTLQSGCAR